MISVIVINLLINVVLVVLVFAHKLKLTIIKYKLIV